ncbi:hypothetical protein SAMN05877838_2029 [Hoeflea halophila]|uniref:Uncharacterized protein n=1 Tax=Hoeflea halophila TaxID=714899 RepID=A0A286IAM0_9HYPH|nr:hypothetical protein SAMN05877838_2029 [Hoeflea halophila]
MVGRRLLLRLVVRPIRQNGSLAILRFPTAGATKAPEAIGKTYRKVRRFLPTG